MTDPDRAQQMQMINELPLGEAVAKLLAIGEQEVAESMARSARAATAAVPNAGPTILAISEQDVADSAARSGQTTAAAAPSAGPAAWPRARREVSRSPAWMHNAHVFGYIASADHSGSGLQPIRSSAQIPPDNTLKGARINVTLHDLHVAEYPGRETHQNIWVHFAAHNQTGQGPERLDFITVCRVGEGERDTVLTRPIFVGLQVGDEGLDLQCITVKIANKDDETLLQVLESNTLQGGLLLQSGKQPSLPLFSTLMLGLTKTIATHKRNVAVQAVNFGLDFSRVAPRPRLAEGSYIAVQVPDDAKTGWRWQDWGFDPVKRLILSAQEPTQTIPYNYIAVGVSRMKS